MRKCILTAVALFILFNTPAAFSTDRDVAFAGPEIDLQYLSQDITSGYNLDMGKVAVGFDQNSSYFTLYNSGDTDLNLTDVSFTGTDASLFSTDLTTSAIGALNAVMFRITVTAEAAGSFSAQLVITSDDADEQQFIINIAAEAVATDLAIDLYGPEDPPPRDMLFSQDGNGVGRVGGLNYRFANVNLAATTPLYWGTFLDAEGKLEVKMSMNDQAYEGREFMEFYPSGSDLPNGVLMWIGRTTITDYLGTEYNLYTRFVLAATYTNSGAVIPLIEPARLGMDNQVGGLVPFTSISDQVSVNMRFEASLTFGTGYQPYLDYYDTFETDPTATGTASSFWPGFFWNNVAPRMDANMTLDIEEGDEVVITSTNLSVIDDEDIPADIQFEFVEGTGSGTNPMKGGELLKEGVAMTINDDFTMQDILDGSIVYAHDGTETLTEDNFVFKASDSKGLYVMDGEFDAFTFRINITIINDPPVAESMTFTIDCGDVISDQVTATDEEGGTITFEVVTEPSIGTLDLNTTTGEFTVTGIAEAGETLFQFRAYDGNSYSENTNVSITVNFTAQTIDFPDPGVVLLSDNTLTLNASASSGLDVIFSTEDTELTIDGSTATLLQTGEVSVKADQAGDACYSEAEPVTNTFCIEPDAPSISASGLGGDSPVLTSSVSVGNQWYKNGTLLSGATAETYVVADQGSYTVTVTENGCESQHSEAFIIVITALGDEEITGLEVYPNPVNQWIMIRSESGLSDSDIRVIDLRGREIYRRQVSGNVVSIDVQNWKSGVYMLLVKEGRNLNSYRLIKN